MFFLNSAREDTSGSSKSSIFRFLLVNIGAFFECVGAKDGFEFRFEKLFGFEPPKSHDISSEAQKKVKSKLTQTAEQIRDAQKRLEKGDYKISYCPCDDFQTSSAWNCVPPPLSEKNRKIRSYELMKELAEKAGFCVLGDPKLRELDQEVKEVKATFSLQESIPED